jgi:hypothetical protein
MSSLRPLLVISSAAIANCVVVLVTLSMWGWNFAGGHAIARNSARFSGLCFVIAFAGPGLERLVRGLPNAVTLFWAWFAAHLVHFASVLILFATFERSNIAKNPGQTAVVVLFGAVLVFGAALTARTRALSGRVLHNVLLYAIFGIFTLAFARDKATLLHVVASLLILALGVRLSARLKLVESKLVP